jgi:phytoene dehydrogenase-like protein
VILLLHQTIPNIPQIMIVGAGLGGLGAAIALLLAGHDVEVFESASEIGEVCNSLQFPVITLLKAS